MQAKRRQGRRSSSCRRRTRAEQVQSRRFALTVCLLALMVVITAAVSYSSGAEATPKTAAAVSEAITTTTLDPAASLISATYTAELKSGDSGSAYGGPRALLTLDFDATAQTVTYKLQITAPLANPSTATICQSEPGQGDSTVFTIFPGPTVAGNFSGVLAEGSMTPGDLVGPLKGGRLTDLVLLVKNGGAYAAIGTPNEPVDALRAQIK
jgi:hypothetical protein